MECFDKVKFFEKEKFDGNLGRTLSYLRMMLIKSGFQFSKEVVDEALLNFAIDVLKLTGAGKNFSFPYKNIGDIVKIIIENYISHLSDCGLHNEPAYRNTGCNCNGFLQLKN